MVNIKDSTLIVYELLTFYLLLILPHNRYFVLGGQWLSIGSCFNGWLGRTEKAFDGWLL